MLPLYAYTREGGYLAAVYGNVYLDLSYGFPCLSLEEMAAFTRAVLGVAPTSKLPYRSDAGGAPELHWMSAHDGRRILGRVLGEADSAGDLTRADAEGAGQAILRKNASGSIVCDSIAARFDWRAQYAHRL